LSEYRVIDAHLHMISKAVIDELMSRAAKQGSDIQQRLASSRRQSRVGDRIVQDIDPGRMAEWWCAELDKYEIDKAVYMSFVPDSAYFREFIAARPDRIFACCTLDPTAPDAVSRLESEVAAGYVGVKLYPTNHCYRLSDAAARPFFEKVRDLGIPVAIHYGISVAPTSELSCANPVDLHPVARDFPEIPFIIVHFGAGYLGEVLELHYHCDNIYVDTSGTNNWRRNLPYDVSLRDVFAKCLDVMGADHILYGTDSGGVPSGYRDWVLLDQADIVENRLGLTDDEKRLVMRDNAVRLYKI
jgi:predicted TIM-barrel fold metal-dependent hydrolase